MTFFTTNGFAFDINQTFTIGVENIDLSPVYSIDPKTKDYKGLSRELLDMFAQKKGYKFVYKTYLVKELFTECLSGNLDFKYPDNPSWEWLPKSGLNIYYSDPVITIKNSIMILSQNRGKKKGWFKRLGIIQGFTPSTYTEDIKIGTIDIIRSPSISDLIKLALLGKVDGVLMSEKVTNYHLKKLNAVGGLIADQSLLHHKVGYYFLSSIRYPKIIKEFNQFLKNEKGSIQKLKEKY